MCELKALAASLQSSEYIQFIGPVKYNEVPGHLTKFDVYIVLGESESYGVVVVEAEACGIPVIVSSAGGLPEVIDINVSGFIVLVGDWKTAG
jgi:glycosyltransferase involved in cell wall biosynthesis